MGPLYTFLHVLPTPEYDIEYRLLEPKTRFHTVTIMSDKPHINK